MYLFQRGSYAWAASLTGWSFRCRGITLLYVALAGWSSQGERCTSAVATASSGRCAYEPTGCSTKYPTDGGGADWACTIRNVKLEKMPAAASSMTTTATRRHRTGQRPVRYA